jgi:uncharacterized protein
MSARRLLPALVLPAVLLAGPLADSAFADVQTTAPGAVPGGTGTVTFTATAGTSPITRVEVALPTDTPLMDVTVPAVDGWTSATTDALLPSCGAETVNHVTWTATGGAPTATGDFAIQVGQFPKQSAEQVVFTGVVTHADGTVERFTEPEAPATPNVGASAVAVRAEASAPAPAPALNLTPPAQGTWLTRMVTLLTW